jgi:chemosensory pili system protein ChpA (sensor histidine kinase/response regulator)
VAHGLERQDRRENMGKPRVGVIELAARQELGQIVLEVRDDGKGLDLGALREQGIAMGLAPSTVSVDDPQVRDLVFAAGLSTEKTARAVAGRGVGCDVVRRAVERLNGSIRVESEKGKGTTFVLTLPLTLAITKALLVQHAGQAFALPLYFAERILDPHQQEVVESAGVRRVRVDGQWCAVQSIASFLGGASTAHQTDRAPIVVLRVGTERMLLQVDAVIGQEESVVKSLGTILTGHPLFAGVTIRGNGEMVLIVDVPGMIETRAQKQGRTVARAPAKKPAPHVEIANDVVASEDPSGPISDVAPAPAKRKLRVMFVDDSLSVRKVAEKILGELGVEVTTALDGLDALGKMREASFDLVFTDLEMPRMHGFELIRELRFIKSYQDVPIVVVTSRSGQKHQDQARSLGANEYLTKPFTAQSLAAAIEKLGHVRSSKESGE